MKKNWFDLIYYTVSKNYIVTSDLFEEMCTLENDINAVGNDRTYEQKKKKSELLYDWLNSRGIMTAKTVKTVNQWVSDKETRDRFYKFVDWAWDKLTALSFDEKNMSIYNEILSRIIKTSGKYLEPDYKWDANQENSDNDKFIPSAEDLVKQLVGLQHETLSIRDILKIYYSFDYMSVIMSWSELANSQEPEIMTVVSVAETLADTDRMENDTLSDLFELFGKDYHTDNEFLNDAEPVVDKITIGDISLKSIFDVQNVRDMLNHVCSMFEERDDILIRRMNILLDELDIKEDDYQDAYQKIEEMLRKLVEYVRQLEQDVLHFAKALKEPIHPNHMEFTVPECIAKWQGFISSDLYKHEFGENLINDIKANVAPKAYDALEDSFKQMLNKDKALDVINILRELNIDDKTGVPEGLFVQENIVVRFDEKIRQWDALAVYLRNFFSTDYNENKRIEMAKVINQNFYDAACSLIYILTSDKSGRITVRQKKVTESIRTIDEIMIFEKTVIAQKYGDFKALFDKVYKNFLGLKMKSFADFVSEIIDSFKDNTKDEQPVSTDNTTQQLADEVKQAFAAVANGK